MLTILDLLRSDIFTDVVLTNTGDAVIKVYLSGHAVNTMNGQLYYCSLSYP
jgi:hypothetical protein